MTRSSSPSTQVPSGKYRCFLRDQRLTQTAVEAVFEVEKGPHAGKCLQETFADAYRVRKVSAIDSTTPVIVHVISKATRNGQRVTRIVDILPLHTRAEVTVLGGMPTGMDDGDEEFAALAYNLAADVDEMHRDLFFLPTGQLFWATPLVPEAMASDLYSSLTREPSENPFGETEPFEPDRYWIGRTLKRILPTIRTRCSPSVTASPNLSCTRGRFPRIVGPSRHETSRNRPECRRFSTAPNWLPTCDRTAARSAASVARHGHDGCR